jgi:hypothetical protein
MGGWLSKYTKIEKLKTILVWAWYLPICFAKILLAYEACAMTVILNFWTKQKFFYLLTGTDLNQKAVGWTRPLAIILCEGSSFTCVVRLLSLLRLWRGWRLEQVKGSLGIQIGERYSSSKLFPRVSRLQKKTLFNTNMRKHSIKYGYRYRYCLFLKGNNQA